ncbi:hypothetical protein [Lacticaseibacillus zhaodongensis]|uniref:hypothetical protein n=1 Tax=Lacticaseibacillus zhaodongensis TaxID=2668065 RepID=UPI0012D30301|nr:hypothetical protein [Lacticaseibacillus zhaodongensis]
MELYWETDPLHAGRMTPVTDKKNSTRYLLRRSFSNPIDFKLMNSDAHLLGSIKNSREASDRFELELNGHDRYTMIRLTGSTHPVYILRGSNWLITGNLSSNRYTAYHVFEAIFSMDMLAGGASLRLWTSNPDNNPYCVLLASALDQIRTATIRKQTPLSYSF